MQKIVLKWVMPDPVTILAALFNAVAILLGVGAVAWEAMGRLADPPVVRAFLLARPGVGCVHDLHIRATSTTLTELTAHIVMPGGHPGDEFLDGLARDLAAHHGIGRATIQIERGDGPPCRLAD